MLLMLSVMLSIGACSSARVYTTDKTIVYKGALFNMSNVQKISSSVQATLANGDKVNMRTLDKKGVKSLLDKESSVVIQSTVLMDDQKLEYQNASVSSYSKYSDMVKKLDRALNNINKFMAKKKKTQLKLK